MMHGPPRRGPVPQDVHHEFQRIGRQLESKGLVCATDGNLSLRDGPGSIILTASGAHKGDLRREDLVRVDLEGRLLWGPGRPSSESALHVQIYRDRPEVVAVVHAHPPVATAFAVAGCCLNTRAMPESILTLGEVPFVQYATPGTEELSAALAPLLPGHDAFLLAHHGAVAVGSSLQHAFDRMVTLEHTARILLAARLLGGARVLTDEDLRKLLEAHPHEPAAGSVATGGAGATQGIDVGTRPAAGAGGMRKEPAGPQELVRLVTEAVLRHLARPDRSE